MLLISPRADISHASHHSPTFHGTGGRTAAVGRHAATFKNNRIETLRPALLAPGVIADACSGRARPGARRADLAARGPGRRAEGAKLAPARPLAGLGLPAQPRRHRYRGDRRGARWADPRPVGCRGASVKLKARAPLQPGRTRHQIHLQTARGCHEYDLPLLCESLHARFLSPTDDKSSDGSYIEGRKAANCGFFHVNGRVRQGSEARLCGDPAVFHSSNRVRLARLMPRRY